MWSTLKISCRHFSIPKFRVLFLMGAFHLGFPVHLQAAAEEKNRGSIIFDLAAPSGLSETEKKQWEQQHEEMSARVTEQYDYIVQGDGYLKANRYEEALQEYQLGLAMGATKAMNLYIEQRIGWTYEVLGRFSEAAKKAEYLFTEVIDEEIKQDTAGWKRALEAAVRGHYDIGVQLYRELLATSDRWKRPSMRPFLEQRLHLMEERARKAGQLETGTNSIVSGSNGKVTR